MKTLVLSSSDMIYTSSLKHLAIEVLVHRIDGKLAPFWGVLTSVDLESWRLNSSNHCLGKTFLHKHLPKSCDLILPDPTRVRNYLDNLNM